MKAANTELTTDVLAFAEAGARSWRLAELKLPAIEALPEVALAVDTASDNPDARFDAIETALQNACRRLEAPLRDAALAHLGFDPETRDLSKSKREDAAGAHVFADGRTYRRLEPRPGGYPSWLMRTITRIALALAPETSDYPDAEPTPASSADQPGMQAPQPGTTNPPNPHRAFKGELPRAAFVCALPSRREQGPIYSRFRELERDRAPGAAFFTGLLDTERGTWRVALLATERGNTSASRKTSALLTSFRPNIAIFVGCAGGFSEKRPKLGDLVVPRIVHLYASGSAGDEVVPAPKSARADKALVDQVELLQHDQWFTGTWHDSAPEIYFEDIVTGERKVKSTNSEDFRYIRAQYNQAVAVEMEGYGFLEAADAHRVPALLIRGISDLLDDKTELSDELWQPQATGAATDLAIALLAHGNLDALNVRTTGHRQDRGDVAADVLCRTVSQGNRLRLLDMAEALGIKPCIDGIPGSDGLSHYIERPEDRSLREALGSALEAPAGLHTVLVDGPSFSGKTRAVVEALDTLTGEFVLVVPAHVEAMESWLDLEAPPVLDQAAVVLLLDELESFVPLRRFPSWFDRLNNLAVERAAHPLVLVATCGGSGAMPLDLRLSARIVRSTRHIGAIRRAAGRDELSKIIRLSQAGFEAPEILQKVAGKYDKSESTTWTDLARSGTFLRALWAGPWLEQRYRHGSADGAAQLRARGQAMAWGSMLLRRVGCGDWPAPRALLEELHYRRLGGGALGSDASVEEIDAALDWATQEGPDGLACLVQKRRSLMSGDGYVSPAFLAERLLDETDVPRTQADADDLLALLAAHGASEQLLTEVGERMATAMLRGEGADPDAEAAPTRRQVVEDGATRGSGQPADVPLRAPRGIDLAFDDPTLQARLRATGGLVVVQLKAEPGGRYDRGLALVVASSEEANAPQHLLSSTVRVDRSPGPAWKIETGLPAPQNEAEWLQLADLVTVLPLTSHS